MKRSLVFLFSCLALAGSAWLGHVVWGQTAETKTAETKEEKKFTITQTQLDQYVAKQIEKALAAEREKAPQKPAADKPVSDEQVRNPDNWHFAVVDRAAFVVYTGPGQFMFHHWVQPKSSGVKSPTAPPPPAVSSPK